MNFLVSKECFCYFWSFLSMQKIYSQVRSDFIETSPLWAWVPPSGRVPLSVSSVHFQQDRLCTWHWTNAPWVHRILLILGLWWRARLETWSKLDTANIDMMEDAFLLPDTVKNRSNYLRCKTILCWWSHLESGQQRQSVVTEGKHALLFY